MKTHLLTEQMRSLLALVDDKQESGPLNKRSNEAKIAYVHHELKWWDSLGSGAEDEAKKYVSQVKSALNSGDIDKALEFLSLATDAEFTARKDLRLRRDPDADYSDTNF